MKCKTSVTKINAVYPPEAARVGAVLLVGVDEVFGLATTNAELLFDRDSLYAWIRGYVLNHAAEPMLNDIPVSDMIKKIEEPDSNNKALRDKTIDATK